jgi:hypothetical protein
VWVSLYEGFFVEGFDGSVGGFGSHIGSSKRGTWKISIWGKERFDGSELLLTISQSEKGKMKARLLITTID